MGAKGQPGYQL